MLKTKKKNKLSDFEIVCLSACFIYLIYLKTKWQNKIIKICKGIPIYLSYLYLYIAAIV